MSAPPWPSSVLLPELPKIAVGQHVAGAAQVGAALQHQGLHVRRQRVVDGGEHGVVALAGALDHRVAGIVDEVGVVAAPPTHGVGAGAAVDEIVAGVAEDRVGRAVAEALQVGAALEHQRFHIGRQTVVDRGETPRRCLRRRSRSRCRRHCRRSRCRCRRRRSWRRRRRRRRGGCCRCCRRACWPGRCRSLQVGAALQHQGFHVRRQPVVDRGEHRVVALAGALDHHIAGIVDEVGVVAGPPVMASAPAPPSRRLLPVLPNSEFGLHPVPRTPS